MIKKITKGVKQAEREHGSLKFSDHIVTICDSKIEMNKILNVLFDMLWIDAASICNIILQLS